MIWFSSDHHFYHTNVIKYCNRPYASVEEMNADLLRRWNEVVQPDDEVYYLGDFALSKKALPEFLPRLNGEKHLIAGNHDHCHPLHARKPEKIERMTQLYIDHGFASVALSDSVALKDILEVVEMHHMPYSGDHPDTGERFPEWRPRNEGRWLLHGHVHGHWKQRGKMINVGVDVWDYYPVSLDAIVDLISKGASP